MKKLWMKILAGFVAAISRLPFGVLYALSDLMSFSMLHIIAYRRRIVAKNIDDSFPELSPAERKQIVKQFYVNFCDYIVETIKLYSVSAESLRQRIVFDNIELVDSYLDQGHTVITYFSHCFNWEWVTFLGERYSGRKDIQLAEVYRPLRNEAMDSLMLHIRTRFNTMCFPKSTVFRDLIRLKAKGINTCTGFMSDQKPSHGDREHIIMFLNHPTAVITGTELVARKMQAPAVYFDMTKVKRGHYRINVIPISDNVAQTPDFEVTDRYFSLLEANIRREPAIWLWSHNRWKRPVKMPESSPTDSESVQ